MADSNKRKDSSGPRDDRGSKKSKGSTGGKWQTPHQKTKLEEKSRRGIEPGDQGIWVTCERGKEGKATAEIKEIFNTCAEDFYGLNDTAPVDEDDEKEVDIEAAFENELAEMTKKGPDAPKRLFQSIRLSVQCVLFFKVDERINPVKFVEQICEAAVEGRVKSRFLNRLTPMTCMERATDRGLEDVCRTVLEKSFRLRKEGENRDERDGPSYAIRPSIRNHSNLKRDAVIKQVASLISSYHKVDLKTSDLTILVEIYQTSLGISVVPSESFTRLKRYNLYEIMNPGVKAAEEQKKKQKANSPEKGQGEIQEQVKERVEVSAPEEIKVPEEVNETEEVKSQEEVKDLQD